MKNNKLNDLHGVLSIAYIYVFHFLYVSVCFGFSGQMKQSKEQFQRAGLLLKLAFNDLLNGNADIREIQTNNEFYCDSSLNNIVICGRDEVLQTFELRCKEKKIKEIRENINIFMQLCQHFHGNITASPINDNNTIYIKIKYLIDQFSYDRA